MLSACSVLLVAAVMAADDAALELSARINNRISQRWHSAAVKPAARADDAEFLRRVSLDLTGQIPSAGEVVAFERAAAPDKRARLIDDYTAGAGWARHWSNVLVADWTPQASDSVREHLRLWTEGCLRERLGYDAIVRQMLTASPAPVAGEHQDAAARGFLIANDAKPENLAASVARQFLGLNLDCAQCHNHPFARWSQDEFWRFAAFFSNRSALAAVTIAIPDTPRNVSARFPNGETPEFDAEASPRDTLATWLTDGANPYFARNTVNRVWAYLMGAGLVEPLDDLNGAVVSHPELLDELAQAFAAGNYDLRLIVRAIALSDAYQLTSASDDSAGESDPQFFARMPVRGLSSDQMLASYRRATGLGEIADADGHEFKARFRRIDQRARPEAAVLEKLLTMNGPLSEQALDEGATLAVATNAPFLDEAGRVDMLYLAVLGRHPSQAEADLTRSYVANSGDQKSALADLLWSLLNSGEFCVNH